MIVESLVLRCHRALHHVLADAAQLHRLTVFHLEARKLRLLVGCKHRSRRRRIQLGYFRDIIGFQVADPGIAQDDDAYATGQANSRDDTEKCKQADKRTLFFNARPVLYRTRSHEPPPRNLGNCTIGGNEVFKAHKFVAKKPRAARESAARPLAALLISRRCGYSSDSSAASTALAFSIC